MYNSVHNTIQFTLGTRIFFRVSKSEVSLQIISVEFLFRENYNHIILRDAYLKSKNISMIVCGSYNYCYKRMQLQTMQY